MWNKKGNIFNKHHAQLPVVDMYESEIIIYYSTRDEKGRSVPMKIKLDNKNFSPIGTPEKLNVNFGEPGYFDHFGIMPTDIITKTNGDKYLYYIGWSRRIDIPYHNNLGLLISHDNGLNWKKYSNGPVFHTSAKEPGYIGTAEILIEGNLWKMWYLSCQKWIENEPIYDIKYATSDNGLDWKPSGKTCIPLIGNEGGISAASILKIENLYHMWFSSRKKFDYRNNKINSYRIYKAISDDGINWKRIEKPELDISKKGWDNIMVCYPEVLRLNDKYIMFYNGNKFGKTGIGYATRERIT